jgi:hypothetical protein
MQDHTISRRHALALAGGLAGGLAAARTSPALGRPAVRAQHGDLPTGRIQQILDAEGSLSSGVLSVEIARHDIGDVKGPGGIAFKPSFQINGELFFQPLGNGDAFFNGDLALLPAELNPVIDAILSNGLVFQAMHQHFFDLDPMVFFIHFRGMGDALRLAKAAREVVAATAAPLPQKNPVEPTTPLDHAKLAHILHGSSDIGEDGVATITVPRTDRIVIDGVRVSPEANVSTNIAFLPLDAAGSTVAVAPDFSLTSHEVDPVIKLMRRQGFEIGCLYNQETSEQPQLYFSHQFATGDPVALARMIRKGLDLTKSK